MRKLLSLTPTAFQKFGVATAQELWQKAAADGYTGLTKTLSVEMTKGEDEKTFHATFSSDIEDRHGEIVFQNFDLKWFKKNPVYLDSHNYWSIEHIIGRVVRLGMKDDVLQGDIEFALDNPKGALAAKLAEKGFLSASSIGFIPKEFDEKGNILKSELLEISAVSIPANPEALYENAYDEGEPKQEEPEPVAEPAAEPEPEVAPDQSEPTSRPDAQRTAADVVKSMLADQRKALKTVARELGKINEPAVQKRRTFRAIRQLLDEAKADTGVQ